VMDCERDGHGGEWDNEVPRVVLRDALWCDDDSEIPIESDKAAEFDTDSMRVADCDATTVMSVEDTEHDVLPENERDSVKEWVDDVDTVVEWLSDKCCDVDHANECESVFGGAEDERDSEQPVAEINALGLKLGVLLERLVNEVDRPRDDALCVTVSWNIVIDPEMEYISETLNFDELNDAVTVEVRSLLAVLDADCDDVAASLSALRDKDLCIVTVEVVEMEVVAGCESDSVLESTLAELCELGLNERVLLLE
jgi:hypothetical protein